MKKIIAVTGGIGSGKSAAIKMLNEAGYHTLSCDDTVSELYKKRSVKKILKSIFPTAVSGLFTLKIDRKRIAQLAFNDLSLHKKLTDAITPLVLQSVMEKARKINGNVFVEVPLLFECAYQNEFDDVLVITRNKQARVESVIKRSNLCEADVLARMKNQFDYDKNDLSAYNVIVNDGDKNALKEKVLNFASGL